MSAGGNAESVTMTMVLAISAWLSATLCGWAQRNRHLLPIQRCLYTARSNRLSTR